MAILVGAACGYLSWAAQSSGGLLSRPGGDFLFALVAASDLRAGQDPYGRPTGPQWTPYPLPAALFALPFSYLPLSIAGGLFFGLSCGLLTFCVTKEGYGRLWMFLSTPFWFCLFWAQWSPLIMAAAFIPALMPVVLIKPHIALPVVLTHPSRIGIYCCIAVGVLSLIVYPRWPFVWLSQLGQYQRFFPVSVARGSGVAFGIAALAREGCATVIAGVPVAAETLLRFFRPLAYSQKLEGSLNNGRLVFWGVDMEDVSPADGII